jgi:hypothetical protein
MSRANFGFVVELNHADIDRVNAKLRVLSDETAVKSLRNGMRAWLKVAKRTLAANTPRSRHGATESYRGSRVANVHIQDNLVTKVKGWKNGRIQWAALGVKQVKGSIITPHWYLRWVEFGHDIKGAYSKEENIRRGTRGDRIRKTDRKVIGKVPGKFFITKTYAAVSPLVAPLIEKAIDKQVKKDLR